MFRRETVHSHLFVHFSPFSLFFCPTSCRLFAPSAIFPCVGSVSWGSLLIVLSCSSLSFGKSLCLSLRHEGQSSAQARVGVRCLEGGMAVVFCFPRVVQKKRVNRVKCREKCSEWPGRKRKKQTRKARILAISPIIRIAGENKCRNAAFRCYYSLTLQA